MDNRIYEYYRLEYMQSMKSLQHMTECHLQQNDTPLQRLILEMANHHVSRAEDSLNIAILS